MDINFEGLSKRSVYGLLTQVIVPRPIAWVLSENETGTYNLAPFSYFNGVSSEPPVISMSIGRKRGGEKKDSWVNIEERRSFTIHIPEKKDAQVMVDSSLALDRNESEVSRLGLEVEKTDDGRSFLAGQRVALFCEYYDCVEVGQQGLILGKVVGVRLDKGLLKEGDGVALDMTEFEPLARLGGASYAKLDGVFDVLPG